MLISDTHTLLISRSHDDITCKLYSTNEKKSRSMEFISLRTHWLLRNLHTDFITHRSLSSISHRSSFPIPLRFTHRCPRNLHTSIFPSTSTPLAPPDNRTLLQVCSGIMTDGDRLCKLANVLKRYFCPEVSHKPFKLRKVKDIY